MKATPIKQPGFTLIELLVVVAILAILMAILLPSLGRAREQSKATRCLANLSSIGKGLVVYEMQNDGYVVPSYNMPAGTYLGNPGQNFDGWAAILDRDGVIPASSGLTNNVFFCPNTLDVNGMAGGQTLYDLDKPMGYHDWPMQFVTSGGDGATKTVPTLPINGLGDSYGPYQHLIRCGYWLNAQNPIGSSPSATPAPPLCPYYTQSVGYGPYGNGASLPAVKSALFARPTSLIVATDGVYMGRQTVTRLGEQNRRIGYRHLGKGMTVSVNGTMMFFDRTVANTVFADGHAESIENAKFPHSNVASENTGAYSLLANP